MRKMLSILGIATIVYVTLSFDSKVLVIENNNPNEIKSIKIGNQYWMSENLNSDHFLNGDKIPEAKTAEEWVYAAKNKKAAWCYYNNDTLNGKQFGKLYNGYALIDPRGLVSKNWKIPSVKDWEKLINQSKGKEQAGLKLKATFGWALNGNGSNEFNFNALPSGYRSEEGQFIGLNTECGWWSSNYNNYQIDETVINSDDANSDDASYISEMTSVYLIWSDDSILGTDFSSLGAGYAVRCVKK